MPDEQKLRVHNSFCLLQESHHFPIHDAYGIEQLHFPAARGCRAESTMRTRSFAAVLPPVQSV